MTSRAALAAMLGARRVAVVGASPRPGSLAERLVLELRRSHPAPEVVLVNPRYERVGDLPCLPSLEAVEGPVDLVALAVGDHALELQLAVAADRGDSSALIFASAFDAPGAPQGRRARLAGIAEAAGMAVCGAGCMGFVNPATGLRALGYLEPFPVPSGPVALVTHSGSAFSALLRADRRLGWSLAVSSGQELVTTAAAYLDYALDLPQTRVVALLLETIREPDALIAALGRAAAADVPVVALTVGSSPGGRAMVQAHSGALAGADGAWEALAAATGLVRVSDMAELVDTVELVAAGRRPRRSGGLGVATVHDSGAERALAVDLAHDRGVSYAVLTEGTQARLRDLLDEGLDATNPLDVWGTGAGAREVFGGALAALADDPGVGAVALCVDLVPEYDGDTSYEDAVGDAWKATSTPLCVMSNLGSGIDRPTARRLRAAGIPVLEGTASGLAALGHLVDLAGGPRRPPPPTIDGSRRDRWSARLAAGPLDVDDCRRLLADYGIPSPLADTAADIGAALAAAASIGYPVAVKTAAPLAHKTEAGGVALGLEGPAEVEAAYRRMAAAGLGPAVTVSAMAADGVELSIGAVRDPLLGPLVVVGAGGILVEVLADRAVALPPLDTATAVALVDRLAIRPVLAGLRGRPPVSMAAVAAAVVSLSTLVVELGVLIDAIEVNPLRAYPDGVLALDVLVERRRSDRDGRR